MFGDLWPSCQTVQAHSTSALLMVIQMGAAECNDGVSQVQMTGAFLPSIIQTVNAFAWLIWLLLDLVSVMPKIKGNILNARCLR